MDRLVIWSREGLLLALPCCDEEVSEEHELVARGHADDARVTLRDLSIRDRG